MNTLILTPTTDSVWGWLLLAIAAVIVAAIALCVWDEVEAHVRARRAWAAEMDEFRSRHVQVQITADTTAYEAGMRRASESIRRLYRRLEDEGDEQ